MPWNFPGHLGVLVASWFTWAGGHVKADLCESSKTLLIERKNCSPIRRPGVVWRHLSVPGDALEFSWASLGSRCSPGSTEMVGMPGTSAKS